MDFLGLLSAIVFIFSVVAFIVFGIRSLKSYRHEDNHKTRLSLGITGISGITILAFICLVIPQAREAGRRTNCMSDLSAIGKSIEMWRMDHANCYPPNLQSIIDIVSQPKLFICPASGHQAGSISNITEWTDYAYVAGLKETDPNECLLAYCDCPRHKTIIALKLGGQIDYVPPSEFQSLTNNFGITNQALLAEIKSRARIIRGTGQIGK